MKKAKNTDLINQSLFKLDDIIDSMPECLYWKDMNGYYRGCNDLLLKMAGFNSKADIIGKSDVDIGKKLHWDDEIINSIVKIDKEVINTGKPIFNIEEKPFNLADGRLINQLTSKMPLKDSHGNIIGLIGISIDISKQKKAEHDLEQQIQMRKQAYQDRAKFIGFVAHEIKGPAGNIKSVMQHIKDYIENKGQLEKEDVLNFINEIVVEQSKVIESLDNICLLMNLDYKFEGLTFESSSIRNFLFGIISHQEDSNSKNAKFFLSVDKSIPDNLKFDHYYLESVLNILLFNALRFSHENGKIEISLMNNKKQNMLDLTVEDYGIGINKNILKTQFRLFENETDEFVSHKYEVPAIRLSYVNKLTKLINGKFSIHSEVNKGTRITISFPYLYQNEGTDFFYNKTEDCPIKLDEYLKQNKLKLLLVEDNALTGKNTVSDLNLLGLDVDWANSPEKAKILFAENDYNIVFMDISMPGITGIDLKNELETTHNDKTSKVFFVAFTSHTTEHDIDFFINSGFVDVLKKPVTLADFKHCLEVIIGCIQEI